MSDRDELLRAFAAGVAVTCEGRNGEYGIQDEETGDWANDPTVLQWFSDWLAERDRPH